ERGTLPFVRSRHALRCSALPVQALRLARLLNFCIFHSSATRDPELLRVTNPIVTERQVHSQCKRAFLFTKHYKSFLFLSCCGCRVDKAFYCVVSRFNN